MITIRENKLVFGVVEPLPLVGFPDGRAKIEIRSGELVRVYIKTKTGIIAFYPTEKDGAWIPDCEIGRNERR
jgi:hypothetical protein